MTLHKLLRESQQPNGKPLNCDSIMINGLYALLAAVASDDEETVRLLLDKGVGQMAVDAGRR